MKVGFTGSRDGTTCEQHKALCAKVRELDITEFHHGCCVGADAEAFAAVRTWVKAARTVAHPPDKRAMLSGNAVLLSDERREPRPYLDRNRDIVDACDVLLACPKGPEEQRSGTWATVRYARKKGKQIYIFWPNGEVTEEPAK
jgi:hypothetical protein